MSELTHIDEQGRARMVDTSEKATTARRAIASARVLMSPETVAAIRDSRAPKGDPLEAARLAGIMAAKRCALSYRTAGSIWKRKSPREPRPESRWKR